jgi:hypothetical protein
MLRFCSWKNKWLSLNLRLSHLFLAQLQVSNYSSLTTTKLEP